MYLLGAREVGLPPGFPLGAWVCLRWVPGRNLGATVYPHQVEGGGGARRSGPPPVDATAMEQGEPGGELPSPGCMESGGGGLEADLPPLRNLLSGWVPPPAVPGGTLEHFPGACRFHDAWVLLQISYHRCLGCCPMGAACLRLLYGADNYSWWVPGCRLAMGA